MSQQYLSELYSQSTFNIVYFVFIISINFVVLLSDKEEIRSVSAKKVAGCCAFISQLFCYLQNPDGSPKFKPLSSFILEYFELLLDNKAEELELECVCKQV